MKKNICLVFLFLFIFATSCTSLRSQVAYTHTEYAPNIHNRFYVDTDKAFIGQEFDWSGVGRVNGNYKWATLISDSFFVSGNHYHPRVGDNVWFWRSNDPSDWESAKVVWGAPISDSDTWVGMLDRKLGPEYKRYPFFVMDFYDYPQESPVWYIGQLPKGGGFAVGTAVWRRFGSSNTNLYTLVYGSERSDQNNVYGVSGDSGGPTFSVVDGDLALLGTHWSAYMDGFAAQHTGRINSLMALAPSNNTERVSTVSADEPLRIRIGIINNGEVIVSWDNTSGIEYQLQLSDGLSADIGRARIGSTFKIGGYNWETYETMYGRLNRTWEIEVPNEAENRFFRVKSRSME